MKTTVEINDDLFQRVQHLARKKKMTFRALTERGLQLVLAEKEQSASRPLPPLVTVRGKGLTNDFKQAGWHNIRNAIDRKSGG